MLKRKRPQHNETRKLKKTHTIFSNSNNNNYNSANNANVSSNNESLASNNNQEGPDPHLPFTDDVVNAFHKLLNPFKAGSVASTKMVINYLKNKYANGIENVYNSNRRIYPLADIIYNLPKVKFIPDIDDKGGMFGGIRLTLINRGGFGNIFRDAAGNIYKQTLFILNKNNNPHLTDPTLEMRCEMAYRNFLLEAFIQTVLQTDTINAVPKLDRIYVDYRIKRRSPMQVKENSEHGSHPRFPLTDRPNEYSFFYKMDKVPFTFNTYPTSFGCKISCKNVKDIFIKIANILKNFKTKYGFKHRDLHVGNIMFDRDSNPMLIDFGMACMNMGGDIYSVEIDGCESYDLILLIASIYEYDKGIFDKEALKAIKDSMLLSDGTLLYDAVKKHSQIFHAFYYHKIINNPALRDKIPPMLSDNIDEFISYWENIECKPAGMCSIMGGGRKTRRIKRRSK
jgi:hypothetical protein